MHTIAFLILLFFICICIHVLNGLQWKAKRLPPRLTLYTIIQNLGAIFRSPHKAFAELSKTHGPIFCLKILNMTIVFMCSSHLAKEVLQKQDKVLSDRPVPDAARALNHHEQSIVWLPSTTKWRELRKICVSHIFSSPKILAKIGLRQEKLQQLLNHVHYCCNKSQAIDIGQVAFITSLNVLSNTLFSIDLASYDSNWAYEFKQSVLGISKQIGSPNTADYFLGLSLIDPQGIRQASKIYMKNIMAVFEGIVKQRLEAREISEDNDALDTLLKLHKENNSEFSLDDIKHLLLDLFIAGAETTSSTLQWAMVELFRNSKVLSKVKLELQHAIPKDTQIQESDIQNLPYLQAIVKETYRLHPPIPLAVHEARCLDGESLAKMSRNKDQTQVFSGLGLAHLKEQETMFSIVFLILLFFISTCILVANMALQGKAKKLPPNLPLYSITQNIFAISRSPHQALAKLSKTYGPIMCIKLWNSTTVVMSSPHFAKEALQNQDKFFSDRLVPDLGRALNHHEHSILLLPASTKWRAFRKYCVSYMFSSQKIEAKKGLRQEKVKQLLKYVHDCCNKSQAVEIGQVAFTTSLNVLSNTLLNTDLASYESDWAYEFKQHILGISKQAGKRNSADYFWGLRLIDPHGIRRATKFHMKNIFAIFEGIVNERLHSGDFSSNNDVLDGLLKLHKENASEFSVEDIKHLLLDLFLAGIETTSSTLEWAMSEVLRNPKILSKAKLELQQVIPKDTQVQESDIQNLPYLQAIIKETYRLHPAIPLLVHQANCNVQVSGFTVPKNAQVIVNLYAVGRDSNAWPNPDTFIPERFWGLQIDAKGQNYGLTPYGAGRRMCVGLPLADRMLHLVLGSLLHLFDWKLEDESRLEDLNMDERCRFTVQKAFPLKVIPTRDPSSATKDQAGHLN
ncbi:Cytochrome P450 [Dillenia turbinata]|uniref:Cytochrome P450 n=1 Tax=Dillenia turbinata TaxID=194707 RepID=A0AAN8UZW8_9MAGN